nr:mitogen activated protein kinase kinase kinase [Hymenolepis microstoma]
MECSEVCQSEIVDNIKRPGKFISRAKPLSSGSSLSSSGVSFEDTISDISHFTTALKNSSVEACGDLFYTHSSSSGFITNRDDSNTISSMYSGSIQGPQVFTTPILRESSRLNRSQLQQIRKSFLPYTGSSQFEDDDLEEEESGEEEENIMTRSATIHISTAHFNPPLKARVSTISPRPSDLICKSMKEEAISPSRDEELALTVSNFLINLKHSSSLQIPSPDEIIESTTVTPLSIEKASPTENFGCFRAFFRLFTKEVESVVNHQIAEEPQWEWPPSEIHDLQYVGSGAQGSVYKATLRGRVIAVKKVSKQSETEIRHLRGLSHSNVVQFLGVSIDGPWYSILMEYCPNGNFFDVIHNNISVGIESIIDWTQQIAQGMNYLHSHKVIHRDLKSPNILIGEDGQLKISDFGVSKEITENSTKMSFAGTVAWMAPEIMRDEPCSLKVDVWSFGVIVWEIITCEIPFNGVDVGAIIYGIASNRFSLPIPTSCPTEFRVLMKRCWCPKPRNRPNFPQILSQLELACSELLQWREDDFSNLRTLWQEEIHLQLMDLLKEGSRAPKLELSLMRQRRQELKDAQTIRQNYEEKLHRVNQLCSHLKALTEELEREQQKISQERSRYRLLIYERSRSTTPFGLGSFTKVPHPPDPQSRSNRQLQARSSRRRRRDDGAMKFTCRNCGTVNNFCHPTDRTIIGQKNIDARSASSGQNSRWLKNWCAATKSKIIENAFLMKTRLRRFASVGDLHEESENKRPENLFKSVNVPTEELIAVPTIGPKMLSQARPLDSELEEQADDETSCEISLREENSKDKNPSRMEYISTLRDDIHCSKGRNSWSLGAESTNREQKLISLANGQNSPSSKNLPLGMFLESAEEMGNDNIRLPEEFQRSLSASTSYSTESDEGFNGSKATVIFKHLNSRPQSGDICRTRPPKVPLPSRGISSDRLQERRVSRLIEKNDDLPPCLPSTSGPTLSISHRSSPRLRQQPGRRLRRTPQSSLPAGDPSLSPSTNSNIPSSVTTSRSQALDLSLNSSSISTSPSLTKSQMRRSIEKLTMELTDHIADSLSEKERRVDVIEQKLLRAACDRYRCLPVHSMAIVTHDKRASNTSTDSEVGSYQYGAEKPWLSTTDLNSKINELSIDTSSILDNASIATDSETDVL